MGLAQDRSAVADTSYLTSDLDLKISAHLNPPVFIFPIYSLRLFLI